MNEYLIGRTHHISIPSEFGSYRYQSTIGKGSFAVVILVKRKTDDKLFACKVVSQQYLIDNKLVESFKRECDTFAKFDHPNVLKLLDFLSDDKLVYMIMEYCALGDLHMFISTHGKLAENQAKVIFRDITTGVNHLHRMGIAHRDLKLENVLIDEDMCAKICDFGFSKPVDENGTLMSTKCGSPIYTAPEIITQTNYDGQRADLWSLGVILYVLLVGSIPWDATNEKNLFFQIITAKYHIPETISPTACKLISELMEPQPEMRITAHEVLTHPWFYNVASPFVSGKNSSFSFNPAIRTGNALLLSQPQPQRMSVEFKKNVFKETGKQSLRFMAKRVTPLSRRIPITERKFDEE
jgi:serine/threonine protein kinase